MVLIAEGCAWKDFVHGTSTGRQFYIFYIERMKSESRAPASEPICKKIQNYIFKFTDLLGQGNFSKVYKAHHQITNETVAVKIIELNSLKSQKLEELLFSEIDVLKKLNHPNILRCYEVFTSNRNCYIITEICNGGDLETKLRREHHFSEQSVQPIIKDIFSGLLYLSHKNVIHRDLKVANVFLHNGRAKIADFGFAKFTKENFKDINIGSPIYMSPEGLIHNIYGPKTDIWAFGVLLYELLHGETPYAHCRTEAELKYQVSLPITTKQMRPELSPEIKEVIIMCMEVDEIKRISASELENLSYFKRLMEKSPLRRMDSPVIEKKYSSTSQKYMGSNNNNNKNTSVQQNLQRHNFLVPKEEQYSLNLPYDNKSSSKLHSRKYDTSMNQKQIRNFSTEKNLFGFGHSKNDSTDKNYVAPKVQDPSSQINSSKIFSAPVTFKECVNLLHYCRLIYKYVVVLREWHPEEEVQGKVLASWLNLLMEEIKNRINENGIVYEGENAWLREKKLREVTNEYAKKYKQELFEPVNPDLTLPEMLKYCLSFYERIDQEISRCLQHSESLEKWLPLGHYMVMMVEGTWLVKRCLEEKSYRALNNYKELEAFLNKKKEWLDYDSYKVARKKVSFIREKKSPVF